MISHSDGQQRCPSHRAFGKKTQRERQVENEPTATLRVGRDRPETRRSLGSRWALKQFVSSPIRQGHEQHEPHVGDGGFRVHEGLERKRKDNCSPPPELFSSHSATPGEDQYGGECRCNCRRKASGEIVFAENVIAGDLCPVGEGRLIESKLIIEVGNDVVLAFDHFARSFGKARLIPIDQRQAPCPENVKQNAGEKQYRVFCRCRFQCGRSIS